MTGPSQPPVVTFDLFSALLDSRTGGSRVFARWATERGWPATGEEVYGHWDAANKEAQRQCRQWVPFRELSRQALEQTYVALRLSGNAAEDCDALLDSVSSWAPWPDVLGGLPALAAAVPVGILSNVDDDIFARTQVVPLVSDEHVLTSERLRAYKPAASIYRRALDVHPGLVHVASSARDVRGALEAGVRVVRLGRPGHRLDPAGPVPEHEAENVIEVRTRLEAAGWIR